MLTLNSQQGNCCNRLKTLEPIARDFRTGMTPMDLSPYLLFDIAHSHYAINAKVVEEVFFLPELTTMAEAPRDIVGMFNLRGTIVPVFDLPHCLGHRRQRYQLSDSLITIHDGELKVTFLVNQVREVVQIDPESITRKFIYQPQEGGSPSPDVAWGDSPSLPLRQRQRFLKGVVQIQTHLVSLLDEEAILQALRLSKFLRMMSS